MNVALPYSYDPALTGRAGGSRMTRIRPAGERRRCLRVRGGGFPGERGQDGPGPERPGLGPAAPRGGGRGGRRGPVHRRDVSGWPPSERAWEPSPDRQGTSRPGPLVGCPCPSHGAGASWGPVAPRPPFPSRGRQAPRPVGDWAGDHSPARSSRRGASAPAPSWSPPCRPDRVARLQAVGRRDERNGRFSCPLGPPPDSSCASDSAL